MSPCCTCQWTVDEVDFFKAFGSIICGSVLSLERQFVDQLTEAVLRVLLVKISQVANHNVEVGGRRLT